MYTSATTDLIADITGYTTTGYQPTTPPGLPTPAKPPPKPPTPRARALPLGGGHVVTVTATRATEAGFLTAYDLHSIAS